MTRESFVNYKPNMHAQTELAQCIDEVEREITVRKRLYDRWVAESKCTWQEAHDRLTRLMGALKFLHKIDPAEVQIELEMAAEPKF